ncbi:MAG: inverse autotransporter beta domain-containing protein [Pseudomonadota bacterium]
MRQALLSFTILSCYFIATPAHSQEAKWSPHIEFGGKAGTKRNIGEVQVFAPILQNNDRLFFADVRGMLDSDDAKEFNAGLGVRQIIQGRWIAGVYGFYDQRLSDTGNRFHQLTFGAEAMTAGASLRANVYIPIGKTVYSAPSSDSVSVGSSSITVREGQERAMKGVDFEAGLALPKLDLFSKINDRFWVHGGGYAFFDDEADSVWGPRFRAEYRVDDLGWSGTRLSLTAEYQYDEPRGGQAFWGARVRLPLQLGPADPATLSPLERRMTETIIRDVDVVSQVGTYGAPVAAVDAQTGESLDNIKVINPASTADLVAEIENAGAGKTTFVYGNGEKIEISDSINLQAGQSVKGSIYARHPETGRSIKLGQTHISGTDASKDIFEANDNTLIAELELSGGRDAISSIGYSNVTVENVSIHDTARSGVNFESGSNLKISGVSMENLSFDSADGFSNGNPTATQVGVGIRLHEATNVSISDAEFKNLGMALLANHSNGIEMSNATIEDTASEAILFHYSRDADLDNITIDRTGADGAAFVASGDVRFTNSSLSNLGEYSDLGVRSGVNISSFTGDGSVFDYSMVNKGYQFSGLTIDTASNSGMMIMEISDSSFSDIKISNVELIGIQVMNNFGTVENLYFDNIEISNAKNAGFWMAGSLTNITGSVTTSNSPVACGRSPWFTTSLTNDPGNSLIVNGTEVTGANVTTFCSPAYNF